MQDKIEIVTLNKNEFYLKENSICNSVAFVENGLLIWCKTLDNGNEATIDFAFAGEWVSNNYHLANYLGIAPKSLSRIRNTIFSSEK